MTGESWGRIMGQQLREGGHGKGNIRGPSYWGGGGGRPWREIICPFCYRQICKFEGYRTISEVGCWDGPWSGWGLGARFWDEDSRYRLPGDRILIAVTEWKIFIFAKHDAGITLNTNEWARKGLNHKSLESCVFVLLSRLMSFIVAILPPFTNRSCKKTKHWIQVSGRKYKSRSFCQGVPRFWAAIRLDDPDRSSEDSDQRNGWGGVAFQSPNPRVAAQFRRNHLLFILLRHSQPWGNSSFCKLLFEDLTPCCLSTSFSLAMIRDLAEKKHAYAL